MSPRNPLNIGAAARAMSNFGAADLRLVNPYAVAWQEARSAVGATAVLKTARVFSTVAEAIADRTLIVGTTSIGHRRLEHTIRRLEQATPLLRRSRRPALLFGSEKFGLSNEDLSHCHWLLRIPTRAGHGSMNLGQAVAVCLYEIVRQGRLRARTVEPRKPATAGEVERFSELLIEALEEAGYLKPATGDSMVIKVRRMVRRLDLAAHDATLWQGMVRQILWRMKTPPG